MRELTAKIENSAVHTLDSENVYYYSNGYYATIMSTDVDATTNNPEIDFETSKKVMELLKDDYFFLANMLDNMYYTEWECDDDYQYVEIDGKLLSYDEHE